MTGFSSSSRASHSTVSPNCAPRPADFSHRDARKQIRPHDRSARIVPLGGATFKTPCTPHLAHRARLLGQHRTPFIDLKGGLAGRITWAATWFIAIGPPIEPARASRCNRAVVVVFSLSFSARTCIYALRDRNRRRRQPGNNRAHSIRYHSYLYTSAESSRALLRGSP